MKSEFSSAEATSPSWPELLFGTRTPVSRTAYVIAGVSLMALKFAVEETLVRLTIGTPYGFWQFISPLVSTRRALFQDAPTWLPLFLQGWTFIFIWIAVTMSCRRAVAGGLSPWLGVLILVPIVNWISMFVLAIAPDRKWIVRASPDSSVPRPRPADFVIATAVGVLSAAPVFLVSAYAVNEYGQVLFFGTPVLCGAIAGFVLAKRSPATTIHGFEVGLLAVTFALTTLLLFAMEGMVCVVMALPLVLPLGCLGGVVGCSIARLDPRSRTAWVASIIMLPGGSAVEHLTSLPTEHCVTTEIVVTATPETVWRNVIRFPDLPPPTEVMFRAGISCPMGAAITGTGVGAERRCIFTTGEFVEPITVWDEPRHLAFDVQSQPEPMFEMTPFRHVHPPHLKESFVSTRGEFRLLPMVDGRTRLIGRTWYRLKLEPAWYWSALSSQIIHAIHGRVLEHIKTLSEDSPHESTALAP